MSLVSEPALEVAHRWGELRGGLPAVAATLRQALDEAASHGASYADVRLSEVEELRLYAVSDRPVDERLEGNAGIGVRVLIDGVWGFASLPLSGDDDGAAEPDDHARLQPAPGAPRPSHQRGSISWDGPARSRRRAPS